MSLHAQGMRTWLLQRLTAVYIAIYLLLLIGWLVMNFPVDYVAWHSVFRSPVALVATIIFYLSLFTHAWVGMRDIFVDYIKPTSVRFIFLTALAIFLLVMAIWLLLIVISLVQL